MVLNLQSSHVLRAVLEGLVLSGVTSVRMDEGNNRNALYPPDLDEDEAGWYETQLGTVHENDTLNENVLTAEESAQAGKSEHDLGWFCRWVTPWEQERAGSWNGPFLTEAEALVATRGEYSA